MCGIVGYIGGDHFKNDSVTENILKSMSDQLYSRGPDSSGIWYDSAKKIGFGHRRLAILDLSELGHQPMQSSKYCITYNGEIYNHLELREQIKKNHANHKWLGSSDTETILKCCEVWGIRKTLDSLIGMFSIAIWDKTSQNLILARVQYYLK